MPICISFLRESRGPGAGSVRDVLWRLTCVASILYFSIFVFFISEVPVTTRAVHTRGAH